MTQKIDIWDAEFGLIACMFSFVVGMYVGEEKNGNRRKGAASLRVQKADDGECCAREQAAHNAARHRDAHTTRTQHALRTAFARVITSLRELADELDAAGLSALGTSALNEAREIGAMSVAALQRLEHANDNSEGQAA